MTKVVEHHYCLRMRDLSEDGHMATAYKGETKDGLQVCYTVIQPPNPLLVVYHPDRSNESTKLGMTCITTRGAVPGERWFLLDSNGDKCTTVFWSPAERRWDSRRALGLHYLANHFRRKGRRREHTYLRLQRLIDNHRISKAGTRWLKRIEKLERMGRRW